MNYLKNLFLIIKVILLLVWITFWFFFGFSNFIDTPKQIKRDKAFVEKELKPAVRFVQKFKADNNRLPTKREFYTWERVYYKDYSVDLKQPIDSLIESFGSVHYHRNILEIVEKDQHKFRNANWVDNFAISAWRGEWMEYYFSWNNNYDGNNYTWVDGFIGLIALCGVGLLPLMFLFWYSKRRRNYTTTLQNFRTKENRL